jgi:hypothetical protein
MPDRKKFIAQLGGGLLLAGIPETVFGGTTTDFNIQVDDFTGGGSPGDEKFWNRISRKYYDLSTGYTNLENGYYGVQPKPVLAAYQKNILLANRGYARFARKEFPALSAGIKKELAVFLGVSDEEIIITRNATEALNIAIQGYPFRPGMKC